MTSARHRAVTGSVGAADSGRGAPARDARSDKRTRGTGPRGMWWVAWRQHRVAVLIALMVLLMIAGALLGFRAVLASRLAAAGCSITGKAACPPSASLTIWSSVETWWRILRIAVIAAPIVLGAFVGAPIFPREFDQRTTVFALTQSVGRLRWWASKVTVAGVPLLAGLLGLGFLAQWVDEGSWLTSGGELHDGPFQAHGIMPAAFGLLTLAVAVTAGIAIRSVIASLVAGLIVAGALVVIIGFPLRPHLLPATRHVTPIADVSQYGNVPIPPTAPSDDPGALALRTGFVDSAGREIPFDNASCTLPEPQVGQTSRQALAAANDAMRHAYIECHEKAGITGQFTDYLPSSTLWPVRGIVTALCILLAALFLSLGALRLRAVPRSPR